MLKIDLLFTKKKPRYISPKLDNKSQIFCYLENNKAVMWFKCFKIIIGFLLYCIAGLSFNKGHS